MNTKVSLCVAVLLGMVCLAASQALNPPASGFRYTSNGDDWTGTCHDGKSQSPVDVYEGTSKKLSINDPDARNFSVELHYHRIATDACGNNNVTMLNNGVNLEISGDFGFAEFGNGCDACGTNKYDVKKVVFRSPSEHTIDGKNMDMELQIVHQKQGATGNSNMLIVSVLFHLKTTPGGDPFLESIEWGQSPTQIGNSHIIKGCVDLNRLSSSLEDDYFAYSGSLTTPPCDETVTWLVMNKLQGISQAQLDIINKAFSGNNNFASGKGDNRKVQPLNGRTIYYVVRHPPTSKQIMYDLDTPVS